MTTPTPFIAGNSFRTILWGGLLAGAFDLGFAFIYYGPKLGVVQSVAGGLLGRTAAYQGGVPTALLGGLLHFLIAFIWAGIFCVLSRRLPTLVQHAIPAGLAFGLVVFYGMNLVVLPLSALHTKAWPPPFAFWPIAMHMVIIGLPIALITRKFSRINCLQ